MLDHPKGRRVLNRHPVQRGVTLIELMVTLAILAFLLLMAGPSFSEWMRNSKLRSAAESILSGIQLAKSEAVSRNTRVRFQLTSSLDNTCALSAVSANWVVNTDPTVNAAGLCGTAPSDTVAPLILQKHEATNTPVGMEVAATTDGIPPVAITDIVFNGLGRPTPAANVVINLRNPTAGECTPNGPVTCLRIIVSAAGQVRMCNPRFALPDPQGC